MEDREYLAHIQNAIVEIKAHTAGMDRDAYEADTRPSERSRGISRSWETLPTSCPTR